MRALFFHALIIDEPNIIDYGSIICDSDATYSLFHTLTPKGELMRERMYFGHPINMYNTPLEVRLLEKISFIFPEYDIENPNQPHHAAMYQKWKEEVGNGMKYFFEEVLPHCTTGIFLPFRDGKYGAGVYDEAKFLAHRNLPIYRITAESIISPIALITEMHALRIKETKLRVYAPQGGFAPY